MNHHHVPKYIFVSNQLKEDINNGAYANSNRLEPEHVLMQKYQVSRQTIRQAVDILENSGLVERRQGSGTYVLNTSFAKVRPRTVGLISNNISENYFYDIISNIEGNLTSSGYLLQLSSTRSQLSLERKILLNYLDCPVDGLIIEGNSIISPNPNAALIRQIISQGTPVIFINGIYEGLSDVPCVDIGNYAAGREAVNYLYQEGHKNIGGIFGLNTMSVQKQFSGFSNALLENGLPMNPENIIWFDTSQLGTPFNKENFKNLDGILKNCTAIVCSEDASATRIMNFLYASGYSIPNDFSVISLFSTRIAISANITSFEPMSSKISDIISQKIIHMMNGAREEGLTMPIGPIIQRGSVSPPRQPKIQ